MRPFFSLIIPTFNEANNDLYLQNLQEHGKSSHVEIIIVDAGSTDQTHSISEAQCTHFITEKNSTRGHRLNIGSELARGDWIVWVHPRTRIKKECLDELTALDSKKYAWGAWTHSFDKLDELLRWTSWYSNHIRGDRRSIFYLDHCLFIHQELYQKFSKPLFVDVAIFEDTLVSIKLREQQKAFRLKTKTMTSSIRFQKNGFFKQALLNFKAKVQFHLKFSHELINKDYEKNLSLNGLSSAAKETRIKL